MASGRQWRANSSSGSRSRTDDTGAPPRTSEGMVMSMGSSADLAHVAVGLYKPILPHQMAGPLRPDAVHEHPAQLFVRGSRAHGPLEIGLLHGEEAVAELAVRGQPDAVARGAE